MNDPSARVAAVLGPVQVLLIGIEKAGADEMIAAELRDLGGQMAIEVLDLAWVRRDLDGEVRCLETLAPRGPSGAVIEALLFADPDTIGAPLVGGAGGTAGAWFLAERIPRGADAAVVLVEHRWAIPLREAVSELEAEIFGDAWVHPRDLVAATDAVTRSRGKNGRP